MILVSILLFAALLTWAFFKFVGLVKRILQRSQRDGLFKGLLK